MSAQDQIHKSIKNHAVVMNS